jgi:hypothetical protein
MIVSGWLQPFGLRRLTGGVDPLQRCHAPNRSTAFACEAATALAKAQAVFTEFERTLAGIICAARKPGRLDEKL